MARHVEDILGNRDILPCYMADSSGDTCDAVGLISILQASCRAVSAAVGRSGNIGFRVVLQPRPQTASRIGAED